MIVPKASKKWAVADKVAKSDLSIEALGAPDEQQRDLVVGTGRENEDESPDFVAFPDDRFSVCGETSPGSHAAFDYEAFIDKWLGCLPPPLRRTTHRKFRFLNMVRRS